jgi:hypothetical protein
MDGLYVVQKEIIAMYCLGLWCLKASELIIFLESVPKLGRACVNQPTELRTSVSLGFTTADLVPRMHVFSLYA